MPKLEVQKALEELQKTIRVLSRELADMRQARDEAITTAAAYLKQIEADGEVRHALRRELSDAVDEAAHLRGLLTDSVPVA